jgi:multidrug efflux pump subunit AcrA (membrane-fusion protein)
VGCTVAVLGASTYLVVDALPSQAATAGLRTATVATGSVTQSTSLSGSVERVDQVTAAFRTAGTVRSVKVAVGDDVEAGDVLATMDTPDLTRAVTVAQANLVAAQAALDAANSSSSSPSTSTGSSSTSPAGSGSAPATSVGAGSGSGSTPAPSASPSAPAKGVDTTPVHRAVDEFDALVQAAVATCQPVIDAGATPDPDPSPMPTPTPTPSETTSPTPSPSPSQTPSGEPSATASPSDAAPAPDDAETAAVRPVSLRTEAGATPTPEQVSACIQALSSALTSAQRTASEMDRLVVALDAAARALQEQQSRAATQGSSGPTTGAGSATGSASGSGTPATGTGSTGGTGGAGGAQSAASLEVDVLKATQELAGAEQDLDGAVLKAPISGRVGQVDLVKGEQASTSSGVVLVGPGAAVVTVDLPLAQLGKVRVAQDVTVTPAGTTDSVPGLVQSISVLPSSTTTSTPTYPVRVTVSDAPVSLATGSTATVTITLATANDVLTVPVSAVTGVSSGTGSVQVVSGSTVEAAKVSVGAVGQGKVQVESGLTAGQVVVLADPATALPSSTTFRRATTSGVSSLTGQGGPGLGGPRPGG